MSQVALRRGMAGWRAGRRPRGLWALVAVLTAAAAIPGFAPGASAGAVAGHDPAELPIATSATSAPRTLGPGAPGGTGGFGAPGAFAAENLSVGAPTFTYDGATATLPAGALAALVYDAYDQEFVAFGGTLGGGANLSGNYSDATWTFHSGSWSLLCSGDSCESTPPARTGALIAYDPALDSVLLVGGETPLRNGSSWQLTPSNTLWSFEGGSWTNLTGRSFPPDLWNGEMTYDPVDGYLLALSDTGVSWEYNGSWSRVGPLDHPSPRSYGAMFYDPALGSVVLYGGQSPTGEMLNDTWTYAGGIWTKLSLGTAVPAPRENGTLLPLLGAPIPATFDSDTGTGLLIDPLDDGGNATWSLGPSGWTNLTGRLATGLPTDVDGSLAYDGALGFGLFLGASDANTTERSWYYSDPLDVATGLRTDVIDANETAGFDPSLAGGLAPYLTRFLGNAHGCGLSEASAADPILSCPESSAGVLNLSVGFGDAAGRSTSQPFEVTVHLDPVLSLPSVGPDPTSVGVPVDFASSVRDGTPPFSTPNWTFDDGSRLDGSSVAHAFATAGNHSVTVRVRDATGFVTTTRYAVVVNPGPAADLSVNLSETDAGFPLSFRADVVGGTGATSCAWNFGDGATASGCNVTHSYATHGAYTARFWTNDSVGASGGGNLSVVVAPRLAASLDAPGLSAAGQSVALSVDPTGGVAPYAVTWSFGDGGVAHGTVVNHTYGVAGTYSATAQVTDAVGARTMLVTAIVVTLSGSSGTTSPGGPTGVPAPQGSLQVPSTSGRAARATPAPWLLLETLAAAGAAIGLATRWELTIRRRGRGSPGGLVRLARAIGRGRRGGER